jgi:ATP-binding cassette subfamily F protein 3
VSLVVLDNVSLAFGGQPIVDRVGLRVGAGDRIGLIGPNGSGKTTLLRLIAGEQEPDQGAIKRAARVRIGYLPQELAVAGGRALLDFVLSSVPGRGELDQALAECEAALEAAQGGGDEEALMALAEQIAALHERLDHFERFYTEHEAARILAGLGFVTADHRRDLAEFSGGWQMRAVLAALLFQQPDLLLLDEPTNHLDLPSVAWFGGFLKAYQRAFFLISHDREFLNEQVSRVVSFEMEGVRQYSGDYEQYVRQRAEEEEVLENQAKNIQREREHMQRFVDRFRAQANKARAVQSRVKALEKLDDVETFQRRKVMRFSFPPTARAVGEVVRIEGLRKAFGDHVVFPGLDLVIRRGEKIGIIGVNGAGKTTLLKMIAGELRPDSGHIKIGNNVTPGYYAQHHADTLHREWTAYEEVSRANPDALISRVRAVLGAFLFSGDDVDKPVSVLSGGERARVALARLLINPGNLLLMDEPTNHLDLESSESLAQSLTTYDGTLVFVSHNRSLIRRLATVIWNVEDGTVEPYRGTLDEYLHSQRLRREAAGAGVAASGAEPGAEAPAAAGGSAEAADDGAARSSRADERERKRREAELRNRRYQVLGPKQKLVEQLERRITKLEEEQKQRAGELSDPAVYADEKRRNRLLGDYQAATAKLEELTGRWEVAVEELEQAEKQLSAEQAES